MIDLSQVPSDAVVTIDTAPIIFLLEDNQEFLPHYLPLFEKIEAGEYRAVISVITLAEILAGPLKHDNEIMADRYYSALTAHANIRVKEMDTELSFMAARIRTRYNLKLPDAIQVATAILTGSSALITHDRDFSTVSEIHILSG